MKAGRKHLVVSVIIIFTLLTIIGVSKLADPAIPGSIIYPIDRGEEKVALTFASLRGDLALAEEYLDLADERVLELKEISDGGSTNSNLQHKLIKPALADSRELSPKDIEDEMESEKVTHKVVIIKKLLKDYEHNLDKSLEKVSDAGASSKRDDVVVKIGDLTLEHQDMLAEVYERVPEEAKEEILVAMERNKTDFINTVDNIPTQNENQILPRLAEIIIKFEAESYMDIIAQVDAADNAETTDKSTETVSEDPATNDDSISITQIDTSAEPADDSQAKGKDNGKSGENNNSAGKKPTAKEKTKK